jgi:hypothetical protein
VALQNIQTPASFWSSGGDSGSKEKGTAEANHPSSWNIEVYVQTLKELVSRRDWAVQHEQMCICIDRPYMLPLVSLCTAQMFVLREITPI